ncbi:hypothetical protein CVS40_0309 [Lucilia cuprina]|nr:hypothetical protein CVS40_0309 [Lucilia cuprina]
MSNTMTAHEPINYLDSILNEEEKRCEYSHQWRNFTISRSGRFKSKNKHRNAVDGKMFDHTASAGTTSNTSSASSSVASTAMGTSSAYSTSSLDKDKISSHYGSSTFASTKSYQNQTASTKSISSSSATTRQRDKMETYKSYYETNL